MNFQSLICFAINLNFCLFEVFNEYSIFNFACWPCFCFEKVAILRNSFLWKAAFHTHSIIVDHYYGQAVEEINFRRKDCLVSQFDRNLHRLQNFIDHWNSPPLRFLLHSWVRVTFFTDFIDRTWDYLNAISILW